MKYIAFVVAFLLFAGCAHVSTPLSETDKQNVLGTWIGQLKTPEGSLTMVFRFKTNRKGELKGVADSPDQSAFALSVTGIKIADGILSLSVPSGQLKYRGKMTGDEIVGRLSQYDRSSSLTLKREPAYSLNLSPKVVDQLLGKWRGKIGPLTVIFRFEKTEDGSYRGYVDSPDQGPKGIPISEVTFADGQLEVKIISISGEYKGQLSGRRISGNWKQPGGSSALTLTKKRI